MEKKIKDGQKFQIALGPFLIVPGKFLEDGVNVALEDMVSWGMWAHGWTW